MNGEPDGTHLTMTRAFAGVVIGDAVSRYFTSKSKDNSTQVVLLFTRVVVSVNLYFTLRIFV